MKKSRKPACEMRYEFQSGGIVEMLTDLKEKFEDMKNKGEVQVEGNWKKFDAEAKEEKKQMKEAKKMEERQWRRR